MIPDSKLVVTALGIGHGDATLIKWFPKEPSDGPLFCCLVDGGESPQRLREALKRHSISRIDLLVVSHFDSDHIGGLRDIAAEFQVKTYWGPCLAAFQRHLWLFGDRTSDGIERAAAVEGSLTKSGADIVYPLEGFTSAPYGQAGPVLRILSPAARMIRTLLVNDDIGWLLTQSPTPLGWLAEPEEPEVEQPAQVVALDERLLSSALAPGDLRGFRPLAAPRDARPLRDEWAKAQEVSPEFFGDSLLNNTSLVLWVDAPGPSGRYRLLLTGDQENWTYLLLKHPFGLQADLLKAPHHGGSVYIENGASHEEILSAVRPRIVVFSANGRYGLPHADIRETAMRWGATVCCTSVRGREVITGSPGDGAACCHEANHCDGSRDVSLTLDHSGIVADSPACHTGFGTAPGPVIQVRQHVIEGSPVLQHLFEQELRKDIEWIRKRLRQLHEQRCSATADLTPGSELIKLDELAALARAAGRDLLAYNLNQVLPKGWERNRFWCARNGYRNEPEGAYTLPTEAEIEKYVQGLRTKTLLLFTFEEYGRQPNTADKPTTVHGLDRRVLAAYCDALLHFPPGMFDETVWPHAAHELLSSWHCYRHARGSIGLSQYGTAKELCDQLAQQCYEQTTRGGYWEHPAKPIYELKGRSNPGFTSVVLVTEHEKSRKGWHEYWFYTDRSLAEIPLDGLTEAADSLARQLEFIW